MVWDSRYKLQETIEKQANKPNDTIDVYFQPLKTETHTAIHAQFHTSDNPQTQFLRKLPTYKVNEGNVQISEITEWGQPSNMTFLPIENIDMNTELLAKVHIGPYNFGGVGVYSEGHILDPMLYQEGTPKEQQKETLLQLLDITKLEFFETKDKIRLYPKQKILLSPHIQKTINKVLYESTEPYTFEITRGDSLKRTVQHKPYRGQANKWIYSQSQEIFRSTHFLWKGITDYDYDRMEEFMGMGHAETTEMTRIVLPSSKDLAISER